MALLDWAAVRARLEHILEPEGDGRLYGDLAAKAVFTMLYVGAVGGDNSIRPSMVLWMSDAAAARADDPRSRADWYRAALRGGRQLDALHREWGQPRDGWYQENTREPLRDEIFRAWLERGAVMRDTSRPTTWPGPIWSLAPGFAALFDSELVGENLDRAITDWQQDHLNPLGLARVAYEQATAAAATRVVVTMPDGSSRQLTPGTSSDILKGVIEQALPRLARQPAVLFLSESANKVDPVDERLLRRLRLHVEAGRLLPDALLFDADPGTFWFVEIVATDGAVTAARKRAMLDWAAQQPQPVPAERCAFLTAFLSRDARAFKRLVASLAWDTWVWFLLEPDKVMRLGQLREERDADRGPVD